ncbi:MAG: hypothetical protein ABW321_20150 [Polyangiales bacterium]
MPTAEELVIAYVSAWNERDERARRAHVGMCWSDTSTVTGPNVQVTGRAALLADIVKFHRDFPGHRGVVTGFDSHHAFVRFTIALVDASGHTVAEAIELGEIGDDGLWRAIVTFWGPTKAVPDSWPKRVTSRPPPAS